MGKSKGEGKKPSVFKVAGAKSLKAKSKPKPVTGNLKKINEIVRKNTLKIDKNLVLLQNNLRQKKEEKVKPNLNQLKKINDEKKEVKLEEEKQNTLKKLSQIAAKKMAEKMKKAGIIIIGDEILKGHVRDINSSFMCKRFHAMGVQVCRITTVPDKISEIAQEVARFSEKYDIVITAGGIGPTHDDITYEAIANAFDDRIILHSEMAEVIRSHFHGSNDIASNPALKMALIPQSSKLIYVPSKSENEFQDKGKHNGLQERQKHFEKKSFPVVQVKNVYVLPGMTEFLEHAFIGLQKIFENPDVNIYTMTLFLETPEIKIVKELNDAVNKFQNGVIFGSYASDSSNSEYKLKITIEGTSLDEVIRAYEYLKSNIPQIYLNTQLQEKDADLVYELSNGNRSLSTVLRRSLEVIETALREYRYEEICISFNAGKDSTVLLHLVWAVSKKLGQSSSLKAIYIREETAFPEVDKFIKKAAEKYSLKLETVFGPIKLALSELHRQNSNMKGIFMGTRRTDPHAGNLEDFQMCDKDWPPLMRINPILDWSYKDVWDFLRILVVPYCSLYDEGYTSIGNPGNTKPNPALRISNSQNKYLPAYTLQDGSLERQGRK